MLKIMMCRAYGVVLLLVMLTMAPLAAAQTVDTNCSPLSLPWATSFEENEGGLDCWTVVIASTLEPYICQCATASSGSNALILAARGDDESILLATPRMAYRADSLLVSFNLTLNAEAGMLQAGLLGDTANASTFIPLLNIDLATAATGYYEFYTTPACGTDSLFVAFRLTRGLVNIDDLTVTVATNCRRPLLPWIGDVGITTATVGWSPQGSAASAYLVRYIAVTTDDTAYVSTYATSCTIYDLQPGTAYNVAVATLCGYDTTSWLPIGTIVTDVSCRQPIGASVAALAAQSAALTWTFDTMGVNQPTAMIVNVYDVTATPVQHGAPVTVTTNYAFVDNLTVGHRYQAVLQTVCSVDTASPITLGFTPLADACVEHRGTGLSSTLPVNAQMAYSFTQMLYPRSLLAGIDSLFAMAVRVERSNAFAPRTFDVYVGHTADSTLTENVNTVFSVKVLDNYRLDNNAEGWVTMVFDAPLHVDTSRNLLITIVDSTTYPTGPVYFGTHAEAYGGSLYGYSLTQPFDPTAFDIPLVFTAQVPDLRLYGDCALSACQPPAAIVTGVTDASIEFRWIGGSASAVRYRVRGTEQWITGLTSVSAYNITGLNSSTRYEVQVGAVCGADTAYGPVIEAMTECSSVSIPYFTDFSAGVHPCWQGVQYTTQGAVVLNNELVSPQINGLLNTLQVRLMLRGSGMEEHVYVGVMGADSSTVTWVDTILVDFGTYEERIAYLDTYSGAGQRVVLVADGNVAVTWALIEPLDDCLPPRRVTVSNVGDVSATIAWQNAEGQTYTVYLREAAGDLWATWQTGTNHLTLNGLQPNTDYVGYAVSNCTGVADASVRSHFRFSTGCGVIRYLPFTESFETDDATQCWRLRYADDACASANPMRIVQGTAHSGGHSFRFSSYNTVASNIYNQYLVSPRISAADSITVSFYYTKGNSASEPFSFGISTEDDNLSNFVWYNQIEPVAGQWERFSKRLSAGIKYVAIQYHGQQNYHLYIDDFTIEGAGCEAPTITEVDEQADYVTIGWQSDAESVRVAITDGLWLDDVEGVAVTGANYTTFTGLQPGRYYTVGVRGICPDGHLSAWSTRRVVTIDTFCVAPVDLMLDDVSFTTAAVYWTPMGGASQWQLCLLSDGELVGLSNTLTMTSYTLEGLENNRSYSLLVRSICSGVPGPWSDTLHFQTTECMPVNDVSYERVNFRTVTISWEEAPITIGRCRIEYGLEGFARGTGNVVVATANPFTISGLEPEPNYDFYLQNYCENGVLSDSAVYLFVPTGLGIDVVGERCPVVTVHPNPATTDITVGVDMPAEVSVTDMLGRQVLGNTKVTSALRISHSSLPSGTYFVRVVSDSGSTTIKLIVR